MLILSTRADFSSNSRMVRNTSSYYSSPLVPLLGILYPETVGTIDLGTNPAEPAGVSSPHSPVGFAGVLPKSIVPTVKVSEERKKE